MKKEIKLMCRLLTVFLFSVFLTSVSLSPAQAQVKELTYGTAAVDYDIFKVQPMEGLPQIYEFLFNDQVVMRYRTMAQGLSARERALIILERANKLGQTLKEGNVAVDCINGSFAVTIEDHLFITVTEADFKANNSTGAGLAEVWAEKVKAARAADKLTESKPTPDKSAEDTQQEKTSSPELVTPEKTQQEKPAEVQEKAELPQGKTSQDVVDKAEVTIASPELKMLELINAERAKAGVKPLVMKPELVKLARLKSQDMIDKNYFNHVSPTYGDPFTMMKNFGIEYGYAGENLAGNPSVEKAHESLMASPGHKKNILNPNYTHVGIGIVEGGSYGKMFTQLFISQQ